jgi:hypothetical protein
MYSLLDHSVDKLFEFFKKLSEKPDEDPINKPLLDPCDVNQLNENINIKISKEEILKCIKNTIIYIYIYIYV